MTLGELRALLQTTGLPVAYRSFKSTAKTPAPNPPFIVYRFTFDDDFKADNVNYFNVSNIDVELYTEEKDPSTEKLVEDVLKNYEKSETDIESEGLIQIIYTIQIGG